MKRMLGNVFLVMLILSCLSVVAAAQTPNLEVTVPKVAEGPQIDGALGDKAWLTASLKGGKVVQDLNHTGTQLTAYPRVIYLCYDDEAIYAMYVAFAPDIAKLKTSGANPWDNDEIEFFLQPEGKSYFQINVDAGEKLAVSAGGPDEVSYAVSKGDIKWQVELAVPFESIGVTPEPGDTWKIGLCGRQISVGDMWLTWNPTYGGFHNTGRFGTLVFGK